MAQNEEMTFVEAVRKRPAMYAGSTSIRGFNSLLKGIIKDIFEATKTDFFSFEIVGKHKGKITFKNLRKTIPDNAALDFWKPYENNFQGFELAALNALSKHFDFLVFDKNNRVLFHQNFEKGLLIQGEIKNQNYEADSFEITFDLDDTIFEIPEPLNADFYLEEIRNLAYLHKGKTFAVIYPVANEVCRAVFKFENGLKDKIAIVKLKGYREGYLDIYLNSEIDDFSIEAAFCFRETPVDQSLLISFVNYHHTHENGTHVDALFKGITQAIRKYISNQGLTEHYKVSRKAIEEILVAAIHIKMKKPLFYGSVRNKLITSKINSPIAKYISEALLEKMENDVASANDLTGYFLRFDY